jgi:hypothetical protein
MTAQGMKFLETWVSEKVPPLNIKSDVVIRALAQKLRDDAGAAGFTIVDWKRRA